MTTPTFALILGIAYLGAGILGLMPGVLAPPPADAPATNVTALYGYLLGLFPVNILHSAVHLAIGAWGLAAWAGMTSAVTFMRSLAVFYGLLAIMGLIPGLQTTFGLIPIHGHDVWLHALTAIAAAYFGWRTVAASSMSAATHRERRRAAADRRTAPRTPIAQERRQGMHDRRRALSGMHPA
jgi:Domain of unknown function (DUF4383)